LFDYRRQAPHAVLAHPTDEHLLPLFVALGAADPTKFSIPYHATMLGALSMDAYMFSPP
jgi:4,5-DOPA dioxygenase extradiol